MNKELFNKREILYFYKKGGKIMSRLPNGKYVFPDRKEDLKSIELGLPYDCSIKEMDKVAFAKLLSLVRTPMFILNHNENKVLILHKDENNEILRSAVDKDSLLSEIEKYETVLVRNRDVKR